MANRRGNNGNRDRLYFLGLQKSLQVVSATRKLKKTLDPWKKSYEKPKQCNKKQRHPLADEGPYTQSYGLSSSHVWMWEPDYKESYVPKNWCFWTVVLQKTAESPLDSKEIKPVYCKGNRSWIFFGRTDAEAPILWPPDVKSWLIVIDPDLSKVEGLRTRRWQRMRWWKVSLTQWMWVAANSGR